ncbi:MAG: alpha/beta hydrolase [Bryobacteraceae bacterium]
MRPATISLSLALVFLASGAHILGQNSQRIQGAIEPRAELRTRTVEVLRGGSIDVSADGTRELRVEVFVYEEITRELAAKSDTDIDETSFSWQLPDGKYYVILRNVSDAAGSYVVRVSPQGRELNDGTRPSFAVMKIFYATDRVALRGEAATQVTFGTEPGDQLQFGICRVSIPRAHRMGELEGPSILRLDFREDPGKHIAIIGIEPERISSFLRDVSAHVRRFKKREAFVFVHGFNTDFQTAARRTAQLAYDLGFEGAAIMYSWPSQGRVGLVSYNKDSRNAQLSTPRFTEFLAKLASETGVSSIYVVAHSMGARVVTGALASQVKEHSASHVRQIALIAPEIDAGEFRSVAAELKQSAEHVTLYASSKDGALRASEVLQGYPRAGEGEPNLLVIPGIDTVDASAVDTSLLALSHSYFADNRSILSDLFYLIRGNPPNERACLKARHRSDGMYWAFMPAIH